MLSPVSSERLQYLIWRRFRYIRQEVKHKVKYPAGQKQVLLLTSPGPSTLGSPYTPWQRNSEASEKHPRWIRMLCVKVLDTWYMRPKAQPYWVLPPTNVLRAQVRLDREITIHSRVHHGAAHL